METNTVFLEVKAIDSGVISPGEVGQAKDAGPGVGVYLPYRFSIPIVPGTRDVTGHVTTPSGLKEDPDTEFPTPGHVAMTYQPQEAGLHVLHVYCKDKQVPGSPFQFEVFAQDSKFIHAFGAGLSHGVVNNPAEFTVVTHASGAKGLCLAIEGPSKADIHCMDNEDGSCTVVYLPTKPGEYNILIKRGDHYICGSPFTAKIVDGPSMATPSSVENFSLKIKTDIEISELSASVKGPSGKVQSCTLKKQPDGHLGFSFSPDEVGQHLVSVVKDGKHISGSPFQVVIDETELAQGHSSKVKVTGDGIKEGVTNMPNEFILDTRDAGFGELEMSIEGPRRSRAEMECYDNDDGTCRVIYKPTQSGTFIINIIFGGDHIPGSPFEIEVEDALVPPPERTFRSASKQGLDLWE